MSLTTKIPYWVNLYIEPNGEMWAGARQTSRKLALDNRMLIGRKKYLKTVKVWV